jgi:hypothetical protein
MRTLPARSDNRNPGPRVDPLAVLVARAEARAQLWFNGVLDLHSAVDELWAAAARDGLVAKLGADAVQRILADAFAPLRDDLPCEDDDWNREAWACAARDYHELRGNKVSIAPYQPDKLTELRRLMDNDISLERAWAELSKLRARP